jgi:DNA-binding winged helix-turn-helix (wHTH) protein
MERSRRSVRFGTFELDLDARELRRRGVRLSLQEKPYQILRALVARPGEVISRQELLRTLWPAAGFTDFDRSLNSAVNRLRDALGDTADNPRFVETLARRGYRFVAPVDDRLALSTAGAADSIAVLPCENAFGDAETDRLAAAMTEHLISAMARLPGLGISAQATVLRYKGRAVDPMTVGRELNVRTVLTSGLALREGVAVLTAEPADAENGRRLWGDQYRRGLPEIGSVLAEIVDQVAGRLRSGRATDRGAAAGAWQVHRGFGWE